MLEARMRGEIGRFGIVEQAEPARIVESQLGPVLEMEDGMIVLIARRCHCPAAR